jgi:hypothetical protein
MAEFRHLQLSAELAESLGYCTNHSFTMVTGFWLGTYLWFTCKLDVKHSFTVYSHVKYGAGFRFSDQVSEEVLNRALQMSSKMISSSAKQDHLEKLKEQSSDPKAFSQKYLEIKENKYADLCIICESSLIFMVFLFP